jgi:hypothetical protein
VWSDIGNLTRCFESISKLHNEDDSSVTSLIRYEMVIQKLKTQNKLLIEKSDKGQDSIDSLKSELNKMIAEVDDVKSPKVSISLGAKQWLNSNFSNSVDTPNQTSRFGNGQFMTSESKESFSSMEKSQEHVKSKDQTIDELKKELEQSKLN